MAEKCAYYVGDPILSTIDLLAIEVIIAFLNELKIGFTLIQHKI